MGQIRWRLLANVDLSLSGVFTELTMMKKVGLSIHALPLYLLMCLHFTAIAFAESSEPQFGPFDVRMERSHFVPMSDGVRLSTDLYFPVGADGTLGTILERTPYNKGSDRFRGDGFSIARFFASHGFVYAVQDKRGKFESEGRYLMTDGDISDGNDTLDWIADQSWSNGNIGMMGCSYPGFTTMMAAQSLNPHLKAIIPQSAAMATGSMENRYSNVWTQGGTLTLSIAAWHVVHGSKVFFRPPDGLSRQEYLEIVDKYDPKPIGISPAKYSDPEFLERMKQAYLTLPVIDIIDAIPEAPPNDWKLLASLEADDPWYVERGNMTDETQIDVPALHINSWHDYGVAETLIHFNFFRENARSALARNNQYTIIAPTTHCRAETVSEETTVGELSVGDARFDFWGTYVRWFDRWLNDNKDALDGMPRVQYFNKGANEWRSANQWPVTGIRYKKFFLNSEDGANSLFGDGRLSEDPPLPSDNPSDSYVYDPGTPYTTVSALTGRDLHIWYGSFDRSELQHRNDVLVFTSDILDTAVDVSGPMKAKLFVSSSAIDTDFYVTLIDVFPDGRAMGVYEGHLRARYREGYRKRVFMEQNEVYEIPIDMNVTSNTFLPGHRIRIEISSSSFPTHDRNLNTGGKNYDETDYVKAVNTIHHSPDYPSYIELPIVVE